MDAVYKKDVPINNKSANLPLKNVVTSNYERKTISRLFFVANFYKNCPLLGLYPKLSLIDRDILDCSHSAGAI
jgi:hypothetical protein